MTVSEVKCSTCRGTKRIEFERGQRSIPCVTCSGSGINWSKSFEATQSELAALREENERLKSESFEGLYNEAIGERDALREELDGCRAANSVLREEVRTERLRGDAAVGDANDAERSLTATEQRNAELVQLLEATRDARDAEQYTTKELRETLSRINALLVDLVSSPHAVVVPLELWKRIHNFVDISLKPTESGASE